MKIVLATGIVVVILTILVFVITSQKSVKNNSSASSTYWRQDEKGNWIAVGTPPACSEPLEFASVSDLSIATSVLYPGQERSVGYEPTAGFRFDRLGHNQVNVTAPMDGEIVYAARFLIDGEIQYVFDVLSPCGIMHRFDHLLELPSKLQAIADSLPKPKEHDNRSTPMNPPVRITKGELLATAIGLRKTNNPFISWTVFDFRGKNNASQNSSWAATHPELYHYTICPFPYLSQKDQERINVLPAADSMSGKKSDFCE